MELNNPTLIEGLINFPKFSMIASIFETIYRFQSDEYALLRLCAVTNWMLEMPLLREEELEALEEVRSNVTADSTRSSVCQASTAVLMAGDDG
jgi:hypothetical protein